MDTFVPKRPPVAIFYGYPARLIAEWCGISLKTALLYKSGVRRPSRSVLRLFTLHRDRKVLGPEWNGWAVIKGNLVDPAGKLTNHRQLEMWQLLIQLMSEMARSSSDPNDLEIFRSRLHFGDVDLSLPRKTKVPRQMATLQR